MKTPAVLPLVTLLLTGALSVTLGGGCTTAYKAKVDAISHVNLSGGAIESYTIRNKGGAAEIDSLRFNEAAQHVKTALSAHGLYETPDPAKADMLVDIEYGMGPPRMKLEEYHLPVFGPGAMETRPTHRGPAGDGTELLGYETSYIGVVLHEKRMAMCGRENKPADDAGPPRELWRVEVSVEDEGRDLRGYLPILASTAMDQIGHNTHGAITTTLKADAEEIAFVRKGL